MPKNSVISKTTQKNVVLIKELIGKEFEHSANKEMKDFLKKAEKTFVLLGDQRFIAILVCVFIFIIPLLSWALGILEYSFLFEIIFMLGFIISFFRKRMFPFYQSYVVLMNALHQTPLEHEGFAQSFEEETLKVLIECQKHAKVP